MKNKENVKSLDNSISVINDHALDILFKLRYLKKKGKEMDFSGNYITTNSELDDLRETYGEVKREADLIEKSLGEEPKLFETLKMSHRLLKFELENFSNLLYMKRLMNQEYGKNDQQKVFYNEVKKLLANFLEDAILRSQLLHAKTSNLLYDRKIKIENTNIQLNEITIIENQ
ncbi:MULTISPECIES: hypothetical protein [Flavobacteriaceae]|uniref:hypothetical protein n=1 Tax=Flavobacteriaceae TaxID=49546 RepID=UPI00149137AE|nr:MULTISPECIES: hypothetical protein [Allomuricauda]MDC6364688.1 hypothetical protein [Muricauda sp. AC10]